MPTYDYKCEEHGYFEQVKKMAESAEGECPTCAAASKKVIRSAPCLDIEAMAKAGMPGAYEVVGDRITKRHKSVSQHHRAVVGDRSE